VQGALNIPFAEIERRYKEIPIAKKIYVYSTDKNASFNAGVLLHDLGFIGAKTINGGFAAWTEYGYPTTQ
jgi:rhodanese-related sulfurtransferase